MKKLQLISLAMLLLNVLNAQHSANTPGRKNADAEGLYALWYKNKENPELYLNQPYIIGGQMVFQWKDLEPEKGQYDFSAIANELAKYSKMGIYTTIQINGNLKPDWLYEEVPYHPEKFSVQIRDKEGSLMFWHPLHKEAYFDLLSAFANFIKNNEAGNYLLGIRQNFNGLGTEHVHVPVEKTDLTEWIIPAGSDGSIELHEWSPEIMEQYREFVLDSYIELFSDFINVFVRNTIHPDLEAKYKDEFASGKLCWFHTSSEVEPRASSGEIKYIRFYDYCRSGQTVAYAEPWASAWGHHGGKTDDRWCSPPQWFYWTQLFNLHCGVSYIGIYSTDMQVAIDGTYDSHDVHYTDDEDHTYQKEFLAVLNFAKEYVGKQDEPSQSPGAWVAFRENNMVLAANGISEENRMLSTFTGDYNFLMERISDDSYGQGITNVGPDNQRYGAWCRVLPAGKQMKLRINGKFLESCKNLPLSVTVTYYDAKGKSFDVLMNGKSYSAKCQGQDKWKKATFNVESIKAPDADAHIVIQNGNEDCYLHMVEVKRQL